MQPPAGGKATKRHITPTNAVITPTKKMAQLGICRPSPCGFCEMKARLLLVDNYC